MDGRGLLMADRQTLTRSHPARDITFLLCIPREESVMGWILGQALFLFVGPSKRQHIHILADLVCVALTKHFTGPPEIMEWTGLTQVDGVCVGASQWVFCR